jgi:ferredoxin-NADP reductase
MRAGRHTTAALAETTGASTVCGSCRPQLGQLVGQEGWTPVMLLEEFEVVEGIRSFRFAPYDNIFKAAKPGQHVIIQACLDGQWVQRPYTLTSPAGETRYREITVRREPLGYFSNWLFDQRQEQPLLRLSEPQGEYVADLTEARPIVCLVAGIGVTPALAILRSSLREGATAPLLIDYCVNKRSQIIYQEELQRAAAEHPNATVRFRVTTESGRITQADIAEITRQYPGARYYLCGPVGYQTAVSAYLAGSGVPAASINIEKFTPVGGSPAARADDQRNDQVFLTIGLVLTAAFLLQAAFQIKWPWLENLQAVESYKRWSGLALLLYMGGQWLLPYLRLSGRFQAAARHYRLHQRQGALLPLVYYFHATTFGYAYLLALSSAFFATIVLAFLEPDRVVRQGRGRQQYALAWLATHVALSVLIVALVIYHIFVVFFYQ